MPPASLRFVLLLFVGALGFTVASAQSGPGGRPAAGPVLRTEISFMLVAGAQAAPEAFIALPRGAGVPIKLTNVKSRPLPYEGPASLVLYAPETAASKAPAQGAPAAGGRAAEAGRTTLATVALPPGVARVLVLLAPGGAGGAKYQAVAVDDDPSSMPAGSIRFLNYAGKPVTAQVGKEVVNLAKGPSKAFVVSTKGAEPAEVVVQLASEEEGGFEKAFSARLRLKPEERQTFILLPPTNAKKRGISVVPSRDVISPAQQAPGARPPAPRKGQG
jgi:hypothetical protein